MYNSKSVTAVAEREYILDVPPVADGAVLSSRFKIPSISTCVLVDVKIRLLPTDEFKIVLFKILMLSTSNPCAVICAR